jgi:hypothetical protein
MKTKILAIAGVASAVIGGSAFLVRNVQAQPTATSVNATVLIDRHPEIHKAMKQLNNAMYTMEHAADDFHGHKKDAMEHTRRAIAELQAALNSVRH